MHHEVRKVTDGLRHRRRQSLLRALRRLLDATGFRVETFSSAEQFLESDHRGRADCLILDVHLGGLSGLDLQERLARSGVNTPVVIITAHDEPPDPGASQPSRRDRVPQEALRRRIADRRHPQVDRPVGDAPRSRVEPWGGQGSVPEMAAGRGDTSARPLNGLALALALAGCSFVTIRTQPYIGGPAFPPRPGQGRDPPGRAAPDPTSGSARCSPSPRAIRPWPVRASAPQGGAKMGADAVVVVYDRMQVVGYGGDGTVVGARGQPDRRARGGGPGGPVHGLLTVPAGASAGLDARGRRAVP